MVIKNNILPPKGFTAMAIFPFVFVRNDRYKRFTKIVENHEKIHFPQQKWLLLVFFYVWYIIEYFIRSSIRLHKLYKTTFIINNRDFTLKTLNRLRKLAAHYAYKNISFEREAYDNDQNLNYLDDIKFFTWIKYF